MDWFAYLAAGILVYVAVAIFLGGTIYQVIRWRRLSSSSHAQNHPVRHQRPEGGHWRQIFIVALHIIGLGLFLGHTRIFGDVGLMLNLLGADKLNTIGNILGTGLGLFFIVVIGYLLIRCLKPVTQEPRALTSGVLLFLIMIIILLGNYLRLTKPFGLDDYRAYMASLVAFSPAFPEVMAASPARWLLTGHVFAANLLLIYFPFSGLIPAMCGFISRLGKRRDTKGRASGTVPE